MPTPKTNFLQIRLSPEDRARMDALAAAEHLDTSTWARRVLLLALDEREPRRREGS
ncbi:MAG: hypothetical protein AB7T37_04120 [Dehalococcoidia bacterium]